MSATARREKFAIAPQPGPQTALMASSADIAIIGGAAGGGKSRGLLMEPLRHKKVPGFTATIFRRTMPEITRPGGIWSESMKIYPRSGAASIRSPHQHTFASGAQVSFHHLQYEETVYEWGSSEIALLEFDELVTFSGSQFWFMQSRLRSTCGVIPYTRAGTNPDAESFLVNGGAEFGGWGNGLISWWIDPQTGFAIPERSGVLRYFIRVNEELVFADDPDALGDQYPDQRLNIRKLTFIPAKLEDNPALMRADPGYYGRLMSLQEVDRERLLRGNWKIRFARGTMFRANFFPIRTEPVDRMLPRVRYWDEASVEGGGDWTVGVLLAYDARNDLVIVEDVVRVQQDVAERERTMQNTLIADTAKYPRLHTVWEMQPGSAGRGVMWFRKNAFLQYSKKLHTHRPTGSKVERAKPLSIRAERGHRSDLQQPVGLVLMPGDWNQPYTDNMIAFPTKGVPDDDVDASSGGHNYLLQSHEVIARGA